MARPLRIEFPGAVYHVTSRSAQHQPVFIDDEDRQNLLKVVAQTLSRFDAEALCYCLMDDHYHFVLRTRQANLSLVMRQLNGVYTQIFNHRHNAAGPLFRGRFKAILVDCNAYLLEICRYVDLNPVRARLRRKPETWAWSSYRAHVGLAAVPAWLDTAGLHGRLLERPARSAADRRSAAKRYATWVAAAPKTRLWDGALRKQIYLGDEKFVKRMQSRAAEGNSTDRDPPKVQRSKLRSLAEWLRRCDSRAEAFYRAHTESGISMSAIARELEISISRVSRLIALAEEARDEI